jgi:protein ImuB
VRVVCILLETSSEREKLAEACFRYTPQVCLGERAVFLEIEGCRKLYTEKSLVHRLQAILKRFGIRGRITIDDDIPTALSLAVFPMCRDKGQLPIEALQIYNSPLKESRTLEKAILALKRLGIKTLAEFHGISRSSIASRFGKEGLVAAQYIETAKHIPWPRFYPIEKIIEQDEIDESYQVKELEPLLFILRKQIDKALLRLRGSGKLASEVQIRMRLEKLSMVQNTLREWKIELSFPQGSVIGLLPIIKERLDRTLQREPLESAVCYLEFEIVRSVYGSAKQKDFLSQKEEEKEAFQTIVARLTEKLGIEKAFFAKPEESYFPEKSWTKSLLEPHDIQLPFSDRPLRMLRVPLKLLRTDQYLQSKSRRWRITEMVGPERLSGDWWQKDIERDYYRVKTDAGEDLWIYTCAGQQEYYLHGVFD